MKSNKCLPAVLVLSAAVGCNLPDVAERKVGYEVNKPEIAETIKAVADKCEDLFRTAPLINNIASYKTGYGDEYGEKDYCVCYKSEYASACYLGKGNQVGQVLSVKHGVVENGCGDERFSVTDKNSNEKDFAIKCADSGHTRYCSIKEGKHETYVPEIERRGFNKGTKNAVFAQCENVVDQIESVVEDMMKIHENRQSALKKMDRMERMLKDLEEDAGAPVNPRKE